MLKTNCLCFLLIISGSIFASSQPKYFDVSMGSIATDIGIKSHNRISIGGSIIKEIIGDESLYQIILSSSRNHIFIVPKSKEIPQINLTLITESNIVIDMYLRVVDENGKTIIINTKND